jgi:hypothetical protein
MIKAIHIPSGYYDFDQFFILSGTKLVSLKHTKELL